MAADVTAPMMVATTVAEARARNRYMYIAANLAKETYFHFIELLGSMPGILDSTLAWVRVLPAPCIGIVVPAFLDRTTQLLATDASNRRCQYY